MTKTITPGGPIARRVLARVDLNHRLHGPETCNLTVRLLRCDHFTNIQRGSQPVLIAPLYACYGLFPVEEKGTALLSEFLDEVYIPWSKANKKSWRDDAYMLPMLKQYFEGKILRDISAQLVEEFKNA